MKQEEASRHIKNEINTILRYIPDSQTIILEKYKNMCVTYVSVAILSMN